MGYNNTGAARQQTRDHEHQKHYLRSQLPISGMGWIFELPEKVCSGLKLHSRHPEPIELGANIATASAIVDLHIDGGCHGLSQSLGIEKQLWVLFPPAPTNLKRFYAYIPGDDTTKHELSLGNKQVQDVPPLAGGMMAVLDSASLLAASMRLSLWKQEDLWG